MTALCNQCQQPLNSDQECEVCLLQLGKSVASQEHVPGAQYAMPTAEQLNAQIPGVEVTQLIGRGGMGAIYHARQTNLDRDVAVKLIAREVSGETAFLERFEREAKTLAKLSHPNIVTIFDYGHTADGSAYLIMEYVAGVNLREAISGGCVTAADALDLVSQVCNALQYAHSKGVVHRDIKPENILLGDDGTLKVADFGIAKIVDDSIVVPTLTATRQVLGSMHYLAPEHLEAPSSVDHRVDLYAVGVVLYELLTGQLPLGRFEAPSALKADTPSGVDAVVLKSLSRQPDRRYQSAAELAEDLSNVQTDVASPSVGSGQSGTRGVSVPFSVDAMGGFAEGVGVMHASAGNLSIEFRIRDAIWGSLKSQTHVLEIPVEQITRLELSNRVFAAKLLLSTDRVSTLGDLPNAEIGRVELKIARTDVAYAARLVEILGFAEACGQSLSSEHIKLAERDSRHLALGLLLILCAVLNAGALAITEIILANGPASVEQISFIICAAIFMGPIAILQLVTGIINLVGQPRTLNIVTCLLACLPISPVWILSCPLAIWALRWQTAKSQNSLLTDAGTGTDRRAAPVEAPVKAQGWGATTMLFIREARWSKFLAAVNVVGAVALVGALAVYQFGLYQAELCYRVVDSGDVSRDQLYDQVRARLGKNLAVVQVETFSKTPSLTISTKRRNVEKVHEALRISGQVELAWLELADKLETEGEQTREHENTGSRPTARLSTEDDSSELIPVASGLELTDLEVKRTGIGSSARAASKIEGISSADILDIQVREPSKQSGIAASIKLSLSSDGRKRLNELMPSTEKAYALGLIVDGLLQAVALPTQIANDRIVFQLSPASDISSNAISAAIRGPKLSSHLILIE